MSSPPLEVVSDLGVKGSSGSVLSGTGRMLSKPVEDSRSCTSKPEAPRMNSSRINRIMYATGVCNAWFALADFCFAGFYLVKVI